MAEPNTLEAFMQLRLPYAAKVVALEVVRRGGGRHRLQDLANGCAVLLPNVAQAAVVLRSHGLNCDLGHDHIALPIGCRWLGMFARHQPALVDAVPPPPTPGPVEEDENTPLEGPDEPAPPAADKAVKPAKAPKGGKPAADKAVKA